MNGAIEIARIPDPDYGEHATYIVWRHPAHPKWASLQWVSDATAFCVVDGETEWMCGGWTTVFEPDQRIALIAALELAGNPT